MLTQIDGLFGAIGSTAMGALAESGGGGGESGRLVAGGAGKVIEMSQTALLIPLLPMLSVVLITLCAIFKIKSKLPAWITVACLAAAFGVTVWMYQQVSASGGEGGSPATFICHGFTWIDLQWGAGPGQHLVGNFSLYIDQLTCLWMLFVTGLGAMIALYASEYMSHDVGLGYCRFFAAFSLFVFSMACLVMGDSMLLLFLGWEGVGLCSYLLIGYFYQKPIAVEAAKKAFIVNRIGDLGLLMGLLTTFAVFGTVEYRELFAMIHEGKVAGGGALAGHWATWAVPAMLTAGAFGKSAQLFFYVWLPDAMEGPTPVSALIHAATMVTAGVYLIARMYPLYTADEYLRVLTVVGWSGAITAFWAATIGMSQFDIKRIMGYSTISQLGFMFAGLGVLTTTGAAFHVFTHAFFKATLFLCCGAVMHGFGGQLDLRKLSGVMRMPGWRIVGIAMLIGCINLAGLPFTAGFFSKDMILAQAFVTPENSILGSQLIGWLLLLTALMTAYYTFRVFFRVFVGPVSWEAGEDAHASHGADEHGGHDAATKPDAHGAGHGASQAHDAGHGHADAHGHGHGEFHPHAPGLAINFVLVVLALCSILAAGVYFLNPKEHGWVGHMVQGSTAAYEAPGSHHDEGHGKASDTHAAKPPASGEHAAKDHATTEPAAAEHAAAPTEGALAGQAGHAVRTSHIRGELGTFVGQDPHKVMYYVSGAIAATGILIAFLLHLRGRATAASSPLADALAKAPVIRMIEPAARRKWYVDEIYNFTIRVPLLVIAHLLHLIDKLFVDGMVNLVGATPKAMGKGVRPAQSGILNGYAVTMVGGIALAVVLAVLLMM